MKDRQAIESLYDFMLVHESRRSIDKQEFGRIMHAADSTEEEINAALAYMEECGGYENLPD